jgi:hypothetical protein
VGSYNLITPSAAVFSTGKSNHTITHATGALSITARAITIPPATSAKIYGATDPTSHRLATVTTGIARKRCHQWH